jgi:predicted dithiol-disulfide oxidoreductase (DUF899 family)
MEKHKVVSREQWLEARRDLLAKEKEITRLRDALTTERRSLPWDRSRCQTSSRDAVSYSSSTS